MSANLLYNLYQLRKKHRIQKKNDWFEKNLKYSEGSSDEHLKNKDVIIEYLSEITLLLKTKNYNIRDPKQFKDDISSYIYKESE